MRWVDFSAKTIRKERQKAREKKKKGKNRVLTLSVFQTR